MDYEIVYDTTPFIQESINEVFHTLRDAIILVALVVLLFLQNWRSALIPLAAVPVAIIGTFAVMWAMGFSLNNLTLFGLVLAIGIVVDDAIVVVEAVEHHLEHGLSPRDATIDAMNQVAGPVIAVGLVLSAVFIPCAFIGGIIGQFFRQFALDHRHLDAAVGVQFADAQPGPVGAASQAARQKPDHGSHAAAVVRGWSALGRLALADLGCWASRAWGCRTGRPICWRCPLGIAVGWYRRSRCSTAFWAWRFAPSTGPSSTATDLYTRGVGRHAADQLAWCCWSTAACWP